MLNLGDWSALYFLFLISIEYPLAETRGCFQAYSHISPGHASEAYPFEWQQKIFFYNISSL